MAAIINDLDTLLQTVSPRLDNTELSTTVSIPGDVTGTLNGVPVQTVIDGAASPGGGDVTVDILENSGTAITVTSSTLFTMPGSALAGLFIGSGGLFGRNAAGATTFSIDASNGNPTFAGDLVAASGTFVGDATGNIAGTAASTVTSNASDGFDSFTDTVNFRIEVPPTNQPVIGSTSVSSSSVGTVDVNLNWTYTQGSLKADYFILYHLEGTGTPTVSSFLLATVDGDTRDIKVSGVPMDKSYKIGIVAARNTSGGVKSGSIVNGWTRTGVTGNITSNINGVAPSALIGDAADGASAWGKFSGGSNTLPSGNVEFNFAGSSSKGGNATNTNSVGTQTASTVQNSTVNFNNRNDQSGTAIIAPTIATNGTAVDHVINTDGSSDVSFEWGWSGTESTIDGFIIYVRLSTSSASYNFGTTPAEELVYYVTPEKRSLIAYGVPTNKYYTLGVKAYRVVDPNISASGFLSSTIAQASLGSEDPYRPSSAVSFSGDVTGTIDGTGTAGVKNTAITISSTGTLLGGGGGSITSLDYSNVSGTKPDPNATQNFFTQGTATPSGGSSGDSYWETDREVMWHNVLNAWQEGGTVNAGSITVGTLAAARIAANSITSDKISVGTLSAINANLGTINGGTMKLDGSTSSGGTVYTAVFNDNSVRAGGLLSKGSNSGGFGVFGRIISGTSLSVGVKGWNTAGRGVEGLATTGVGVYATASTGTALAVVGKMTISSSTQVTNLFASRSATTDHIVGSDVFGPVSLASSASNSTSLGGTASSGWARIFPTNTGTANASGSGINILVTGSLSGTVRTRGTGNIVYIENISDRAKKKDFVRESLGLDFINKLEPYVYELKDMPGTKWHGLVAQDIAKHIDENDGLAMANSDGTLSVDYNGMIAPMITATQELYEKQEGQQITINNLTKLVEKLSKEVDKLKKKG